MIHVRVQLFAAARDLAGCREQLLVLDDHATTEDLLQTLIAKHKGLKEWKNVLRVAVNQEYSTPDSILHDGDDVAIIPPVSGG
jgi:molybdopterin converting factor subunit 1